MKRRHFLGVVGGAAASWTMPASAQQSSNYKSLTIGFMGSATQSAWSTWTNAFVQRLGEHGWVEGRNISIEYRWAEGRPERIKEIAAEFVRLNVSVILTFGNAVSAVKEATSTVPIVFAIAKDPVGNGFVTSLARPGGNVTGLSIQANDTTGKRLGVLSQVVPNLRRLGILGNAGFADAALEIEEATTAAQALGLEVARYDIRRSGDIATAFEGIQNKLDALYIVTDSLINTYRTRIITLALGARLPTTFNTRDYVQAGGLMSYGPNYADQFRRAADYVDKILRGTNAGDIPIEQPTKFDLAINLTTAKVLGISVPPNLLFTADEVIE
jgi:putative ABC transport system substrate-binding protein